MVTNRVGSPVRGDDFYGRDIFVDLVWKKIDQGNILLASPRRFGKTSVMCRLEDQPREGFKVVSADLEHLIEPADLIATLIVQLASDTAFTKITGGLSYFPKTLWTRFRRNFEEVELLKVKVKLRDQIREHWQEKAEELFKLIATYPGKILFLLDEFPMMIDRMAKSAEHREEAVTLLRWFRRLRQSKETSNVRFLIAGSIGIGQILNDLGEIASINDIEQVRLVPFTTSTAKGLLDELGKSEGLELSPAVKNRILYCIGEPIPYFLQLMFSEIEKEHVATGSPVTPALVDRVYHKHVLGVDCKTYFDHYYGRLKAYYPQKDEKAVKQFMCRVAVDGELTRDAAFQFYRELWGDGEALTTEHFNSVMTNLENDFYVEFDFDTRMFRFASKLLRDWWLRHYAMEAAI